MDILILKSESKIADEFLAIYKPHVYEGSVKENKKEIDKVKNKVCRFCGKNSMQATFNKDAHILPKSLGSKNHLSSEECDNCNELFGKFENNLASYLGINRTLEPQSNNAKTPTFQSANGNVKIKNINGLIKIERGDLTRDFTFDSSSREFKINMHTQKFTPVYVYNALFKIALAIMPAHELKDYDEALKYLQFEDYSIYPEMKSVYITQCNLSYAYPFAIIYKRKSEIDNFEYPLHIFCLRVMGFMFQICFPLHKENMKQELNELTFLKAPLIILNEVGVHNITTKYVLENLASLESKTHDTSIAMSLSEESLKNLVSLDLKTKEIAPIKFD
jgi:hypothetical protein